MGINLREAVKSAYNKSKKWAIKVDKMTDAQVVAVYLRLHREGKI